MIQILHIVLLFVCIGGIGLCIIGMIDALAESNPLYFIGVFAACLMCVAGMFGSVSLLNNTRDGWREACLDRGGEVITRRDDRYWGCQEGEN